MNEIFHLCKNEINKSDYKGHLTFGIVLTGGGSKLNNILDLAQEIFEMPIKIGIPDSINGNPEILNNPRFSTSIGIIKYAIENKHKLQRQMEAHSKRNFKGILKEQYNQIMKFLNIK